MFRQVKIYGCYTVLITLLLAVVTAAGSDIIVLHTDHTQNPPVSRRCREVQCVCGTEPRICDVEDNDATCEPCHTGTFQPHTVSSIVITSGRRCKPHRNCTRGTLVCLLRMYRSLLSQS